MNARRTLQTTLFGALTLTGLLHWQSSAASAPAKPTPPNLPAPAPKPIPPKQNPAPITGGYVLTHEHPTYGMAFGGNYAFAGKPGNFRNGVMEKGYTAACGGCKGSKTCDHGEVKGSFTEMTGALGSDMGDHDSHKGPLHKSNSHLRYSTEWIKAAFDPPEPEFKDTRLKIMVAFAVENEAMCEQLYYANKGGGGVGGDGYACSHGDSVASLERQLDAIKAWVGENSSWMEIAYTPADARRIVNADKLAIVLGIESEYSFGAEDRTFDPVERLDRYHDQGVRTFYLAHKINSRLAGADIYFPADTQAGKAIRATQAIAGCFYYDDNVGPFPLKNNLGHNFCENNCGKNNFKGNKLLGLSDACAAKYSDISEVNMADYILLRGDGEFNGFKIYPLPPGFKGAAGSKKVGGYERNNVGLSHDGERVVREAMTRGMIVNIDHTSTVTRNAINTIATKDFGGYPLNALHNSPNSMLVGNKGAVDTPFPHEYDFDDDELKIVKNTGGFFGVRLGPIDAKNYPASGVTDDCAQTSTETAKVLAYLIDQGLNLGYSLDYATVTQGVHSRTMHNCAMARGADPIHRYGSEIAEGLSHIGMMKGWHKELATVGLADKYLGKLKNDGPEAFIQMWERAEAKKSIGKQIPRQTFPNNLDTGVTCSQDSNCAAGEWCTAGVLDLTKNTCKPKKAHGETCTDKRMCASNRCAWGFCADADECQGASDCTSSQYCGDPIAGKRTCKALKAHGEGCTSAGQCATHRCSWGFCADADECQGESDCTSSQYCGDPIAGKRACKALKAHGAGCTASSQCATGRCAWGFCADADECQGASDCTSSQYCGDPIAGKRTCKALKAHGAGCTAGSQCATGRCAWGFCADADECKSSADCTNSQYCGDPLAGKRTCKPLKSKGQGCTKKEQCQSNRCSWGFCADPN